MVATSISGIEKATLNRFNNNKAIYEQQQGVSVNADKFLNFLLDAYEVGREAVKQIVENSSTNGGQR